MEISVLGGKNEIGGNKILVEHKGTRIFLDFGMSFAQAGKFYCEFLQPRKCAALKDFFELGLLPNLKGVYREDYIRHMGLPKEDKAIDAVFLTHAHTDHTQYLHFLRPDILIYSTKPTKIILEAMENTGIGSFSDYTTACEAFTFYRNTKGGLSRVTRRNQDFVKERVFNIMGENSPVKIGSLEVEMVPVDHSLPGACAYIVRSDEGNLVYTGDIRFHGSNGALTMDFVRKAKEAKPRWLLCEGTRIDSEDTTSESEVRSRISEEISGSKGMVFIEHPIRDTDRVNSIFQSAKQNKREFVVNLKLAYLISCLGNLAPFSLDEVKILIPPKSWGLICREGYGCEQVAQDYSEWERQFIGLKNSITYRELQKSPEKFAVSMNMWEIGQLVDIKPKGALWIKSSCEPFCEEMELDEERKKNWLEHFSIREAFAHASGHASGDEIRALIGEINAENLIPIHTEHPDMF
ncbi:MAG: MBL fold metallo-hydrolase [Candidatus Aenigmarchaeota archaeon]|nr:MBL fold metallo-hydrolase [Candidatus Aenigmarchaeota archaeon]